MCVYGASLHAATTQSLRSKPHRDRKRMICLPQLAVQILGVDRILAMAVSRCRKKRVKQQRPRRLFSRRHLAVTYRPDRDRFSRRRVRDIVPRSPAQFPRGSLIGRSGRGDFQFPQVRVGARARKQKRDRNLSRRNLLSLPRSSREQRMTAKKIAILYCAAN